MRASLVVRRRASSRPPISTPRAFRKLDDVPFRRLELSIYIPGNRLSDLPGFEDVGFSSNGEIQVPERSAKRVRSEAMLSSSPTFDVQRKPTASMVGERELDYWQKPLSIETSRPPSWHDALHSHPVIWSSLPGIPHLTSDQIYTRDRMHGHTPVADDQKSATVDFPPIEEEPIPTSTQASGSSRPKRPTTSRSYHSYTNSQGRNRITQWLDRSSSFTSSTTTASTSKSTSPSSQIQIQAHQFQRSQFYKCTATNSAPLLLHQPPRAHTQSHRHKSSISTVSSSPTALSSSDSQSISISSMTTLTTAPTLQGTRSRSGKLRSIGNLVRVADEEIPAIPYARPSTEIGLGKHMHAKEIEMPKGVGLAF